MYITLNMTTKTNICYSFFMVDIFSDWLRANSLDSQFLKRNLVDHPLPIFLIGLGASSGDRFLDLSGEAAWEMVAEALTAGIPELTSLIRTVRMRVPKSFEANEERGGRAYTFDRGPKSLPFVHCPYKGTASDVLTVAHEFSHALQIVASRRTAMPPMARELCAFVGERLLLTWLRDNQPSLSPFMETAWLADNSSYLGTSLQSLVRALEDGSDVYDYAWNYPVARLLAHAVGYEWSSGKTALLFKSGAKAPSHLAEFYERAHILPQRYVLPALTDTGGTVANLYRQIGALLLLDLQRQGADTFEEAIGSRYAHLLQAMQGRNVFLATDREQVPLGYILWQCSEGGKPTGFERRIACAQRLPDLLTAFENHCPQAAAELRRTAPDNIVGDFVS